MLQVHFALKLALMKLNLSQAKRSTKDQTKIITKTQVFFSQKKKDQDWGIRQLRYVPSDDSFLIIVPN